MFVLVKTNLFSLFWYYTLVYNSEKCMFQVHPSSQLTEGPSPGNWGIGHCQGSVHLKHPHFITLSGPEFKSLIVVGVGHGQIMVEKFSCRVLHLLSQEIISSPHSPHTTLSLEIYNSGLQHSSCLAVLSSNFSSDMFSLNFYPYYLLKMASLSC